MHLKCGLPDLSEPFVRYLPIEHYVCSKKVWTWFSGRIGRLEAFGKGKQMNRYEMLLTLIVVLLLIVAVAGL